MDRRAKATLNRDKAARLCASWRVAVAQARYSDDGHWYAPLNRFPAALVDASGYLAFQTEHEYRHSPHLSIGKQISVRKPGISAVPEYVRMANVETALANDVDIHDTEAVEGRLKLLAHLSRERDRRIVLSKKKAARSLSCEVCGFSFARAYGVSAAEYCEVHHLVPLGQAGEARRTTLAELAILCANCHRVVHLRNPPHTPEELRSMLQQARSVA